MRRTPASLAAPAKFLAAWRSSRSKSFDPDPDIRWTR